VAEFRNDGKNRSKRKGKYTLKKLPIILQNEMSECGHAALCMILQYHRFQISLSNLRTLFPTSLKGITLTEIIRMARHFNCSTRAFRIPLSQLHTIKTPAILHWDHNHFVVLDNINTKQIIIHDPNAGRIKLSFEEAAKHFTNIALEINPPKKIINQTQIKKLKCTDLLHHFNKKDLFSLIGLAFLLQTLVLIGPKYLQISVDRIIPHQTLYFLYLLTGAFLGIKLLEVAVYVSQALLLLSLNAKMSTQIATSVFHRLIQLPLSYFERRHLGDIMSRFNSIEKIREIMTQGLIESSINGIMAIVTFSMMLTYNIKMSLIVLITIFLYFMCRMRLSPTFRLRSEEMLRKQANYHSNFMENVRGIQLIKSFNKETERETLWQNKYHDFLNAHHSIAKQMVLFTTIKRGLFGVELIFVSLFGINSIVYNHLTIGMLYAFIFYQNIFRDAMDNLIEKFLDLKIISLHTDRLSDIVLQPIDATFATTYKKNSITTPVISAKNLAFQYEHNEPYIFKNLNLTILPGEFIAITGPSGCGKTTLLKIMMGLLLPMAGEILINNTNIQDIGIQQYRRHIAAVMQNDCLLAGSIADNIALFAKQPDYQHIERAATLAGIAKDIKNMPMQYHTLVGDMGSTLSGGQQQRIFLARALYANPKILFLDEATSHLDIETEHAVNKAIQQLNITRIVIAHRRETVEAADRIIQLKPT